ncbi:MAG TPA: M20/M25/M40 family metallo-hydrolase [Hyphomicrobiales bacterium]|nr:M20/M25/M40 family metallo-hydrolase [Hyphomicrobiales bacterium]
MAAAIDAVLGRLDRDFDQALARLLGFLAIPSVSTDKAYAAECRRAAEWSAAQLRDIGFTARIDETPGQPMVVGRRAVAGARRHVLFYGHYDVQPPDPLALWTNPPFAPRVAEGPRGPQLQGRGTSDDKGQLMTFLEAARAWRAVAGELPVTVTVLLEGEEETGSPSLAPYLAAHREELGQAELALVCDTTQWNAETPAITTSLRGLLLEEVTVTTASRDLHSGMYGGPALNPIHVLAALVAGLHDAEGRVTVPGFYDGVAAVPEAVKAQWRGLGFDEKAFLGEAGLAAVSGEKGRDVLELLWARPTCDVNGIKGGYLGEGSKTIVPAQASAKVSFRLVPGQDPLKLRDAFRAFVTEKLPAGARVDFVSHGASPGLQLPLESPYIAAASKALSAEWGRQAILMGCGASIPIVGSFKRDLGMDALMVGFALDDDRIHSPNEKYELRAFQKGARSWARILGALAEA